MHSCATQIQSIYRMHRCKVAFKNAARLRKQQVIANGFEFTLHSYLVKINAIKMAKRLLTHMQQMKENNGAITIQSWIRRFKAMQLLQRLKTAKKEEQLLKRREEERLRKRQQLILRGQKATKIQSIARAFLAKKEFLAMYMAKYNEQRRNASIKIQSMYRRHNAEKKLQALKQERETRPAL